jgi:hypothetical protein
LEYGRALHSEGKLNCPESGARDFGYLIMKATGGMIERSATLTIIRLEATCAAVAIWLFCLTKIEGERWKTRSI